jgi:hypothetical protein
LCGAGCQDSRLHHYCRRSPGLGVTSFLRKPPPDLAHRRRDIPNGKKASRSRDRISEIPTAVPFAVGLARAGGGAECSSAALVLRHDKSKRMPPRLVLLPPRFSTISSLASSQSLPRSVLLVSSCAVNPSRLDPLRSPSVGLAAAEKAWRHSLLGARTLDLPL